MTAPDDKVPPVPPRPLVREPEDVLAYTGTLWRIHRTRGEFVLPWNGFRTYGPLADMRFDPHPDGPPRVHADVGVHYSAEDIATAAAEMFQQDRLVNTTDGAPWLTSWTVRRPVRLLDLTGAWALRNGAAHALAYSPRPVCRTWVRAAYEQFPDVEGVRSISTMTGGVNITLWARAADAFPAHPTFDRSLADPLVYTVLEHVCERIHYDIR